MGLLLAFIAGAVCATLLVLLLQRRSHAGGEEVMASMREELARLDGTQRELAAELGTRLQSLVADQATVLAQTGQLAQALRRPGVRGQWGQLTLRNVVEAAGLSEHVDFEEEVHLPGGGDGEGAARPDLVVRLPGDGHVPVDAKVPLDAYLDAAQAADVTEQDRCLDLHVRHVRDRVRELGSKAYWSRFRRAPEMVVLFMASEAAFAAAAQRDANLIADAARQRVVIATPSTMLALLSVVGLGWRESALSENAERIRELGGELVQRLATVSSHLARQGKALEGAVQAHNSAVGSFESRLLVTARRMGELGVAGADALDAGGGVASAVRTSGPQAANSGEEAEALLPGAES